MLEVRNDIEESKDELVGREEDGKYSDGGQLVRVHRINEINYDHDPRVYDEYVEELHPSKSMVSVKKIKSKNTIGQRIISQGFLENSQSCSDLHSDLD